MDNLDKDKNIKINKTNSSLLFDMLINNKDNEDNDIYNNNINVDNDINVDVDNDINNDINNKLLKSINIFTTKFGFYIAHALKYLFEKKNINANIIYEINPVDPSLHIILFSQKVKIYPKNYIIYQLEQKDISKWVDSKYEASILLSYISWDYSQSNIDKFSDLIKRKITYVPCPLVPIQLINPKYNPNIIPKNNILFYGSMNDIRRNKLRYLHKKLLPKYKIKIITNIYGDNLIKEILNSKIILNIHFYKDAILETARINEVLSCNRIVISELPNMIDIQNYNLYIDKVVFVNDINDMYNKIIELLN